MTASQGSQDGRHVVVAGGSFAGLAAAYTLRARLRPDDRITLVSPDSHFVFMPSLVHAALGEPLLHSSFSLDAALTAKNIEFVQGYVRGVRANEHVVHTDRQDLTYDRLIIATGGRPDTSAVPGLAGEFRAASWIVGEDSAMEARNALRRFFEAPGPLVVGAAQSASYISGAYELALELDTILRQRKLRDSVPMTFVTAEPYLGHLDLGQTAAGSALATMFAERTIATRVGVEIAAVERDAVRLSNGETLDARTSVIMPPFTGVVDIWKSADLTDQSGMIPVNQQYQNTKQPDVYAAGVASYFAHPVPPLETDRAPQTGYLSLRMGKAAGENVAASLGCGAPAPRPLPYVVDVRVIDGMDTGLLLVSRGNRRLHNSALQLPGRSSHFLKGAIERYELWRLRTGRMNLP